MKTKFAKRFLVALAVVACISAFCVLGACGTSVAGTYTYDYVNGFAQAETAQFVLDKDGTATLTFPGAEFLASDMYVGTYTNDGTTVTIEGLYEEDGASNYPGLWTTWIDSSNGNCKIEVDKKAGTFEPYFFETSDTESESGSSGTTEGGEETSDLVPPEKPKAGSTPTATYETEMEAYVGCETVELALYDDGICTLKDVADGTIGPMTLTYYGTYETVTENSSTSIYVSNLKNEEGNPIPGDEAEMMNFPFVTNCGFKATLTDASDSSSNGTFTVVTQVGTYTYTETSAIGTSETHRLVLYSDETCTLQNLDTKMTQLSGVYYGTYTQNGSGASTVKVSELKKSNGEYISGADNPDTSLGFSMNFSFVSGYGFTASLDETEGTFEPIETEPGSEEEE